jgi:hypothetical protein
MNADETPGAVIGGLVMIFGVGVLCIGAVGTFASWGEARDQRSVDKMEARVSEVLKDRGFRHIEFHQLDGETVVAFVGDQGGQQVSCGAIAETVGRRGTFFCVNRPTDPVYSDTLKTYLRKMVREHQDKEAA